MFRINVLGVALYGAMSLAAQAIPAQIMCIQAISDGRMGAMNIQQCQCLADVARRQLSTPLYLLWTESLYTGTSRMKEIRELEQSVQSMTDQINQTVEIAAAICGIDLS